MMTAIPEVKPIVTGRGMKRMTAPKRNRPISTSMSPAMKPAMSRFSYPYCRTMANKIGMNAPVGPDLEARTA